MYEKSAVCKTNACETLNELFPVALCMIVVVENLSLFEVASNVATDTSFTILSLLNHVSSSPDTLTNVRWFLFAPALKSPVNASTVAFPLTAN